MHIGFEPTTEGYRPQLELRIVDPNGNTGRVSRGYDQDTGVFHFNVAVRRPDAFTPTGEPTRPLQGTIRDGLDVPLEAGRGTPTLLFYTMGIMNHLDVP